MAETRIRGVRLTREERLTVRRLISDGRSFEEAAAAVRCSTKTVQRLLNTVGGMPPRKPTRSKRHLSLAEREEVSRGLGSGEDRDADKRPDPPSLLLTRASYASDTPWRRNRCRAARPRAARLIAVSWCSGRLAGISCSSSRPSISVRPLSRASVVPRPRFRCALEPPCLPRHRFGVLTCTV